MALSTRTELIDYCLRRLGEPVIEVNVDDDQTSDRIDDALQRLLLGVDLLLARLRAPPHTTLKPTVTVQ